MIPTYLADTDPFYQHLLGPSDALNINLEQIIHHINSSTLLACSDGSFNPGSGEGSHGWVFSSPDKTILLKRTGPVSGNPSTNSPYRAKLVASSQYYISPTKSANTRTLQQEESPYTVIVKRPAEHIQTRIRRDRSFPLHGL
jgi:hypothetical protein